MRIRNKILAAAAALGIAAIAGSAHSQSPVVPQVVTIGPNDLFQDVVGGSPQPSNFYASALLLGNYGATQPGNTGESSLIGADFGTNLFQDGATVSTISTTPTYTADQWAMFSGTSTTLAGAQETGASDITPGYTGSLRMTRSGAGVLQSCVAQEVPSAMSTRYQGATAEVDFHALAGSGFSAANSVLNVIVVTGTGTDEGMANLAHTINTALSGSNWAGKVVFTVPVTISSAWARYSVAVPIASTTTEIGVALCYTPVGASPSSDYFEFTGAQMVPNSALASVAGTTGGALNVNDLRAKSFLRRPLQVEQAMQYMFYWRQNEGASAAAGATAVFGTCQGTSTSTIANCNMVYPVPMFKVPTISYTAGTISATVGTAAAAEAVSALSITSLGATIFGANLTATSSSVSSGAFGYLQSGNSTGGGKIAFSARF